MRRLLSPVACWSYTPPDGGGLAPLCPRRFFSTSLTDSLVSPLGWGVAAVPPQPVFYGGNSNAQA